MGSDSEAHSMIFIIITIMMFPSLQRTHILTVDAAVLNAAGTFHDQENETQIKKISGKDESENKQTFIVEKFRTLLGLNNFNTRTPCHEDSDSDFITPSLFPLPNTEAEASAPAPVLFHFHSPRYHSHRNYPLQKIQHGERGRGKRTIVVVLVSSGVGTLICALGCFWVCSKFRSQKKKPNRPMPLSSKKGKTRGTYRNSASNVSDLNSSSDLFYLSCLGKHIDEHVCSLKQTCETQNNTSSHSSPKCTIYENIEPCQERVAISSEYDNASSSSTKEIEILSVHDDLDSVKKYEFNGGKTSSRDKIIPIDCHSSDNESFHSCVESHSSILILFNASTDSLSETLSLSPRSSISSTNQFPCSPQNSTSKIKSSQLPCNPPKEEQKKIEISFQCPQTSTSTPPSPPPPPLTSSFRISTHSPCSLAYHDSSSPINSNHTHEYGLPSPPLFLKENGNGIKLKTPPPPPLQLPQQQGKGGTPLPKLKPLHWDKVSATPDRKMVWDKLRTSSFELDEEMIESLFGYNLQNSMKNDETKSNKTPSPCKHVLEPKRLQNITILSKALNTTAEQVCEALILGKGLSLQQLEALVKMVPTKEEKTKLLTYKGDVNELGSAEKFVRTMLGIPFSFERAEAMLYKESFEDEIAHLSNTFSMLEEACKELRSSNLFLTLLEAVLKTGNRINVGTNRGGARAFKLDALLKLGDVKRTDGQTTLLHFFVHEIVRSEATKASNSVNQKSENRTIEEEGSRRMGLELVSGLSAELCNVKKVATIDLDVLARSVSNLHDGMVNVQNLVKVKLREDEKSESFVNCMKCFLNCAERKVKELEGERDRVLARVEEISEYFHGDVSKQESNSLRIFVIVRDFLDMVDNVCNELKRSHAPSSRNPLAPFR